MTTAALALALTAAPALALEQSAHMDTDVARIGGAATIETETLKAWALAVLQLQQTNLNKVLECAKTQKLWNGTACVSPTGTYTAPTVTSSSRDVTYVASISTGGCCNHNWSGGCSDHDHYYNRACSETPGLKYAVRTVGNQAYVDITNVTCSPGQVYAYCD